MVLYTIYTLAVVAACTSLMFTEVHTKVLRTDERNFVNEEYFILSLPYGITVLQN